MKRSKFSAFARPGVFALSVLLLPLSTPTLAQTATPTPETRRVDTRDERDRTGLWGLLGLAGLLGLMGRRRPDTVHSYTDTRERSRTWTAPPSPRKARLSVGRGTTPTSQGSALDLAQVRMAYAQEAEPMGRVSLPAGVKGKVQTAVKAVMGEQPTLFMDKLGERLAFERSGTRLYEALLSKYDAFGSFAGGPSKADLEHICEEEYRHFMMLQAAIEQRGGDPTAVTPAANLSATASQGIPQVIVDPRTTLLQSLEAVLIAELSDNACWETLVELAQQAGENDWVPQFEQAHTTEQEHLRKVRTWLAAGQGRKRHGRSNGKSKKS